MAVPPIRPNVDGQFIPLKLFTPAGAILKSHSPEAGDFRIFVDYVDAGNLAVSEAPAGSGLYKASPTQAQTNGALLSIRCEDQTSPAAWSSYWLDIWTTTRGVDDLAFPNTSGRGIDVTATGAIGVDWANVEAPTTVLNLSGTTIKAVTDAVTAPATMATLANQTTILNRLGAFTAVAADTVYGWLDAIKDLLISSTINVNGQVLTTTDPTNVYTYTTWTITFTDIGDISGRSGSKLVWTVKRSPDDADADAIVQITETGGLTVLNGAAVTELSPTRGVITVTDAVAGDGTIVLGVADTGAGMEPADGLVYDLKEITSTPPPALITGALNINASVTRKTV